MALFALAHVLTHTFKHTLAHAHYMDITHTSYTHRKISHHTLTSPRSHISSQYTHTCTHTYNHTSLQINAWAVYNWENGSSMKHKSFIREVCDGIFKEIGVSLTPDIYVPPVNSSDSEDLLSPTAKQTPVLDRFVCTKQEPASIARSKKYK